MKEPPSLPRTTSWDGLTNSSSPSQTILIAPSTKKLGIQLKDYTSSGYPWVFMSLNRTHCRNAGISAERLWVRLCSNTSCGTLHPRESGTPIWRDVHRSFDAYLRHDIANVFTACNVNVCELRVNHGGDDQHCPECHSRSYQHSHYTQAAAADWAYNANRLLGRRPS